MKLLFLPLLCVGALGLTSCGLFRTVTQVPLRTLQSVTRGIGIGIEQSEVKGEEKGVPQVKFEFQKE
ncbi:MAG: GAF domain-containing protein [Akkermansiaceae bacterium]|jgi:GAF domain-containing protein